MKNKQTVLLVSLIVFILNSNLLSAQSSWGNTDKDRHDAVEVDTLKKKGYTLIWINKEENFDPQLKQKLIDVHFLNYPKLAKKFNKDTRKEITFVIDPGYDGIAATADGVVRYNPEWFVKQPNDIDIVTHEVMHIVQAYPGGSGPGWLVEGIADYVRYKYGVDNESAKWTLPDLKEDQHYTNSYRIAARFLDWVEQKQKKGIVKKLDNALRTGTYTEEIWVDRTNKTLDELWELYKTENLSK